MSGIGTGIAAVSLGARLSGAGALIKRVPRWVWIALAIALAVAAFAIWHGRHVRAHDKALSVRVITARDAAWQHRLAQEHAAALAWKGRADAQLVQLSKLQRKLTDEENTRIDADARALRLRGAGQAAAPAGCRPSDHPGFSAAAGRPLARPGSPAAAGTSVPAEDGTGQWAVVPWDWLVDVVSEHDAYRVEAIGWRNWDAAAGDVWKHLRSLSPAPSPVPSPSTQSP